MKAVSEADVVQVLSDLEMVTKPEAWSETEFETVWQDMAQRYCPDNDFPSLVRLEDAIRAHARDVIRFKNTQLNLTLEHRHDAG